MQDTLKAVLWQCHKMGDPLNWPQGGFKLSMERGRGHPCNNNNVSNLGRNQKTKTKTKTKPKDKDKDKNKDNERWIEMSPLY